MEFLGVFEAPLLDLEMRRVAVLLCFPRQTEFWGDTSLFLPFFLSPEMLPGSNGPRKAVLSESHHLYKNQKFRFYKRLDFKETSQRNSTQRKPFPQERSKHPGGLRRGQGIDSQSLAFHSPSGSWG